MKKCSKKFFLVSFLFFIFYFLFWPPSGHAQLQPLPTSIIAPEDGGVVEISALEIVFSNILAVATALAGLAVFIMLIVGGFKWMTSRGDPKAIEGAKNTITYAVVGLVLMILAWLILRFIEKFTGAPVTIFQLPPQTP